MGQPTADIEAARTATAALLRTIDGLDDEAAHAPSLLPDWTRGHVLTHLARNADSFLRLLEGAVRGEVLDQYVGGAEARSAAIEAGAGRPAAELVADVGESAARLEALFDAVPDEAWSRTVRVTAGERPASVLPFARCREVEIHHVDLGLGYGPGNWPQEFVESALSVLFSGRDDLLASVEGEPHDILAWLVGREPTGTVQAVTGGPPPDPGPWL